MDPSPPTPYRRLRAGNPLGLRRDACLPLNFSYARCRDCAEACPVGALEVTADTLALHARCTGCGRCAAACQTGALRLEGCEVPEAVPPQAAVVQVDCRKVPRADSPADAVRVPCLEGLAVSQWLALVLAARGRAVEALDRQWCASCEAGGAHLAHGSFDAACALLADMGYPPTQIPLRRARPLPVARRAARIPPPENAARLSRRGFFGRLAREATAVASAVDADAPAARGSALRPGALALPERERRLELLRRLAKGTGTQVPGRMFANLAASAACRDHKICANVCPTGALQAYDDEGATGIAFDAAACIDCGACVRMCVEKALAFAPRTREPLPGRAMRLTRHRTSRCVECEAPCSDASGLCATCRQTRDFAREAFGELFPGGRRSPA